MSEFRSTWEAPRWARVESFLKDQALLLGLQCYTEVDKGFIRESGRVCVSGSDEAVKEFMRRCQQAAHQYTTRGCK